MRAEAVVNRHALLPIREWEMWGWRCNDRRGKYSSGGCDSHADGLGAIQSGDERAVSFWDGADAYGFDGRGECDAEQFFGWREVFESGGGASREEVGEGMGRGLWILGGSVFVFFGRGYVAVEGRSSGGGIGATVEELMKSIG